MRLIFNGFDFEEKARNRTIIEHIKREKLVDPNATLIDENVPLGSVTQDVRYLDRNRNEICRAHRYIRPDGTIGGRGRTDPKTIFIGNVHYHQRRPGEDVEPLTDEEVQAIVGELTALYG